MHNAPSYRDIESIVMGGQGVWYIKITIYSTPRLLLLYTNITYSFLGNVGAASNEKLDFPDFIFSDVDDV